ncbi:hypothetical protein C8Q70DRAFT_936184 [Cubamyces menziesii]|nr:hypothetical protein C8Q70DRAFT_936184 [Cubamyces menziesii]
MCSTASWPQPRGTRRFAVTVHLSDCLQTMAMYECAEYGSLALPLNTGCSSAHLGVQQAPCTHLASGPCGVHELLESPQFFFESSLQRALGQPAGSMSSSGCAAGRSVVNSAHPLHRGGNVPHNVWAPRGCRRDQSHRQKLGQRAAHIVPRSPRLRHAARNGRSSGHSAVLELVASSRRYEQALALGKEAFIDHVLLTHLARLDEIIALVHVLRGKNGHRYSYPEEDAVRIYFIRGDAHARLAWGWEIMRCTDTDRNVALSSCKTLLDSVQSVPVLENGTPSSNLCNRATGTSMTSGRVAKVAGILVERLRNKFCEVVQNAILPDPLASIRDAVAISSATIVTTCWYNSIPRPTQKWPPVLEPTWIWTFTSESGIMSLEDNLAYELLDCHRGRYKDASEAQACTEYILSDMNGGLMYRVGPACTRVRSNLLESANSGIWSSRYVQVSRSCHPRRRHEPPVAHTTDWQWSPVSDYDSEDFASAHDLIQYDLASPSKGITHKRCAGIGKEAW